METAGATEQKIHDRAKQMAVYAYDSRKITDQDFHLGYSTFSGKEDEIDLVAAYRISSQMPVFSFGKPQIIQRGFVRAWSGRDFRKELQKEGNEESKEKVFFKKVKKRPQNRLKSVSCAGNLRSGEKWAKSAQ